MKIKGLSPLVISICLVLVFALLSLMAACAKPAPAPAPAPAPTPAPAPAPAPAAPKVIELKLADSMPPGVDAAIEVDMFAELVAKRTNGRVKIDVYHAEALGKQADFLDMMKSGVCEMLKCVPPLAVYFPMAMAGTELPLLGINSNPVGLQIRWELLYKGFLPDLDDYKVCTFNPTGMFRLWLREKKVLTTEDFKGLKIRGSGPTMTKPFEHFGAVATPMPTPECYMALDRGILDAMLVPAQFAVGMKFYEVVKYGIKQPVVVGAPPVLMSKKVWNDLPVDIQLQVNQAIAEFVYDQLEYWQPKWDESLSKMEQNGVEIYEFNASEWAKLEEMAGPVVDEWVAETEAKGLPARAMAERMQTIAARYK